jgi:3-methyladenine DNA glycosylase AlkD
MNLSTLDYFKLVKSTFQAKGDAAVAQGQIAYMRNQFDFYGLKSPIWMELTKEIYKKNGIPSGEDLKTLVRYCFDDEHRELQYFAIETVQKVVKKESADFIDFLEELIIKKSWWDSVDWLAKLVGFHFKKYPEQIIPITERWMQSGNFWLQRVSIIFQLFYKEKTNEELMFEYIKRMRGSKEFFIQKACGWALRQHTRTNPEAVLQFVETTSGLAPLTKREALRLLK